MTELSHSYCGKDEGRWGRIAEKLYTMGHYFWTYFTLPGDFFKERGRMLKDNSKGVDSQASRGNTRSQRGNPKMLRNRNQSRHLRNNR